jgi:hypothetical protein
MQQTQLTAKIVTANLEAKVMVARWQLTHLTIQWFRRKFDDHGRWSKGQEIQMSCIRSVGKKAVEMAGKLMDLKKNGVNYRKT